jgi:hypothetical protein
MSPLALRNRDLRLLVVLWRLTFGCCDKYLRTSVCFSLIEESVVLVAAHIN